MSLAPAPRCYHSGFDSWAVATETQGNHFKQTLSLVARPTNNPYHQVCLSNITNRLF
jgi:hypothetical protein